MLQFTACIAFACFLVASHSAPTDNDDQNKAFDDVLDTIVKQQKDSSLNPLQIPDFDIFDYIVMKGGRVSDLSTIERVGDAKVQKLQGAKGVKLTGKVSFTDLEIQADELDFNLPLLPSIGKDSAAVKIGKNQFNLDVEIVTGRDGKCQVTVNKFEAIKLTDVTISYKSFTVVNWLASYIAPIFLNALSSTLVSFFGGSTTSVGQRVLGGLNLCVAA